MTDPKGIVRFARLIPQLFSDFLVAYNNEHTGKRISITESANPKESRKVLIVSPVVYETLVAMGMRDGR